MKAATHPLVQQAIRAVGQRLLGDHEPAVHVAFAMDALGLAEDELGFTRQALTPFLGKLVASVLHSEAEAADVQQQDAWTPRQQPRVVTLPLSGGQLTFPGPTLSSWPSGTLDEAPVVLRLHPNQPDTWTLTVIAARHDGHGAAALVKRLIARAREDDNPLRGCHLRASCRHDNIQLTAEPHSTASRRQLRFPDDIWAELDRSVHRHLARGDDLARLGLGQRRGLLLHGPPGTGKTHFGRIVAAEVAGKATTFVVERDAMTKCLNEVYLYAGWLAPSVVLLEDIDVVARNRSVGGSGELQTLLNAMDGPLTSERPVVTVATTNDLAALDTAAVRSGRFDRVLEVPRPDTAARRMVLDRYIAVLDDRDEIDVNTVALATTGATGADLREVLRSALLQTDGPITTRTLLTAARGLGFVASSGGTAYL